MEQINILVVDDEQIVLDSIRKILRREDSYAIYTALSVAEADEIMKENKINVILTDLMMPDIDGLEFIKMVREKDPNILMVMITGYATINTALQAMQIGAFDYVAKPFTRDELRSVVKRAAELALVQNKESSKMETETEKPHNSIKGIGQHTWMMMQDDDTLLLGVERALLIRIGKIQTVYLPSDGDELRQGSTYFQVFSSDMRSESLLSPLSGIVLETNKKVLENPDLLLEDPYGSGWLLRLRPTKLKEELKMIGL